MLRLRKSRRDYGYDWNYYPHSKFYQYYKDFGNLGLYYDWPFGKSLWCNYQILPMPYMTDLIPTETAFRNIRKMISLLRDPSYLNRGYDFEYYPHSKLYQRYRQYGDLSLYFGWPLYSRISQPVSPYFFDLLPSSESFRSVRRMIYYREPLPSIDYSYNYYPETTKYYRPLTLYYNYHWPLRSLNYYTHSWPSYGYWPRYRYWRYLNNPLSESYWCTKHQIRFIRHPIKTGIKEFSIFPSEPAKLTNRFRLHKPLQLYYNYHYPITSLNEYASYLQDIPVDRAVRLQNIFDDETRLIRAQTASLLRRIHSPIPRIQKLFPITTYRYEDALPSRLSNDNYIHRMLTSSPTNPKADYITYWTEPSRKYIGQGHLSCVSYAGERAYPRRRNVWIYEDPLKNDIQLLSYYIQKFRQEKHQQATQPKEAPLDPARPSRKFTAKKDHEPSSQTSLELRELQEARAARLARIYATDDQPKSASAGVDEALQVKKKREEARLAEEKALAEEQAKKEAEAQAKKDSEAKAKKEAEAKKADEAARKAAEEAARKAELARQEELAAQAAAEKAAELERQAELARQEELAKQAEIERAKKLEEERLLQEEEKRLEEEAKAEEERQQLLRLEELARQAEEEKEAELARQADELAELARQEAELAEQAKREAELEELARQQAELQEIARQEAELDELQRQEKDLLERARIEAEAASRARIEADAAQLEAKLAALAQQEAELAELERQQAELDALDAEERALQEESEAVDEEVAPIEVEEEAEPEAEQEAEPEEAAEEMEEEEEPHAIAEDAPETVASDVEVEPEAEEEEEEEE